ncbi:YbhB/YbcL family Raf kinase inhibitor-like protein [Dactylosporangium sp. McL0621]|uniref:YbhB/YbcL family Raf kinase inhibitor-like protein n=1 Tax=Dactylosporangium sp. McL0621 TaxID=3415678 RepID=UPI003CFACAC9
MRKLIAILAGAGALLAGSATAATAHQTSGGFGYHTVRRGIPDGAARFAVASPDVRDGGKFPADMFANAFGCAGTNARPRLRWSSPPDGTRSLAVTMYDPDAPTGSGFWHWLAWDLPAGTRTLDAAEPAGTVDGTGDAGAPGYLGPCPPAGDVGHHYEITVYALDTPSLALPASTPPAVAAFTMGPHVIAYGRLTVTARR